MREARIGKQSGRSKTTVLAAVVFVLAVLGVILYSTLGLRRHTVEVCVAFNGRRVCRSASAATRENAQRTATANACALIANGMTESIACTSQPPVSVTWTDGSDR